MNPLLADVCSRCCSWSAGVRSVSRREPRSGASPRVRRAGAGSGAGRGVCDGRESRACIRCTLISCARAIPIIPIVYEVDRSRDGASFTQPPRRRDPAWRADLSHVGSFQMPEEGIDRQARCRRCRRPKSLPDMAAAVEEMRTQGAGPADRRSICTSGRSSSARSSCPIHASRSAARAAHEDLVPGGGPRARRRVLHRCLLAYASDYYLLGAAGLDAR